MSGEDRGNAAYAIAIENGWDEQEINKLHAWRRAVRGREGGEQDGEVA